MKKGILVENFNFQYADNQIYKIIIHCKFEIERTCDTALVKEMR